MRIKSLLDHGVIRRVVPALSISTASLIICTILSGCALRSRPSPGDQTGATKRDAVAKSADVLEIGDEPQLFIDDWIVAEDSKVRRVLHSPTKHGLIRESNGEPWDRGDLPKVILVQGKTGPKFHMLYRYIWWDASVRDLHPYIGDDKAHWFRESTGYAFSTNGWTWTKPILGLEYAPTKFQRTNAFPFEIGINSSRENNLGSPINFWYDLRSLGNWQVKGNAISSRSPERKIRTLSRGSWNAGFIFVT
jgi:hypothetical protein